MYFDDEEEKRRQQTAQYINTPYGLARNPALGQEKTADVNNSLMINNQQKDEIAERQKQYNSQYNNANEFATGVKNFNVDDWKDIVRKFGLGVEKGADAYSLGAYSQLNKILGGSYEKKINNIIKWLRKQEWVNGLKKMICCWIQQPAHGGRELGLPKILPDRLQKLHHI